ncbi:MAG: response regulator transcription factor [Acidobacteriota bacterium]|nr:response regulator transcription factor [Acidobacteriota bacterium]
MPSAPRPSAGPPAAPIDLTTRALIADDDAGTALVLQRSLARWGIAATVATNGAEAWDMLERDPGISLGIFDWMMPYLEGPALCRRLRAHKSHDHMYLVLLTSRDAAPDLIAGLDAGADDYVVKPFDAEELRARVHVGLRVLTLQRTLAERARELQLAASRITSLRRLLPICSYCKKIRSDQDYWEQLEDYLSQQTDLEFSHGICPACYPAAMAQLSE